MHGTHRASVGVHLARDAVIEIALPFRSSAAAHPLKRFFVFANEHHRATYCPANAGESPNDRNDRSIRAAAAWCAAEAGGCPGGPLSSPCTTTSRRLEVTSLCLACASVLIPSTSQPSPPGTLASSRPSASSSSQTTPPAAPWPRLRGFRPCPLRSTPAQERTPRTSRRLSRRPLRRRAQGMYKTQRGRCMHH